MFTAGPEPTPVPAFNVPYAQNPVPVMTMVMRVPRGDVAAPLHEAERIAWSISPRDKLDVEGVPCDILLVNVKASFEAALTQEPFDLILSDYDLPDYDGVTALAHAQRVQPDVPVIIITGSVGEKEGVRCLHLGATDYLLKKNLDRLAAFAALP